MVDIVGKLSNYEFIQQTMQDEIESGSLQISRDPNASKTAIIRTSDRIAFKRCRRQWGWTSHLRHNLGIKEGIGPLWFGTGIHFALEDFHGYNRFGHPRIAFEAYVEARKKHDPNKLPEEWKELLQLGINMMDYYILWLQQRKNNILKTYWHEGVPQVEVNFRFEMPMTDLIRSYGFEQVYYSGTIDRVCIDEYDQLWPMDYKTAAAISSLHYQTDPQIGVYMWAMPYIYGKPVGGFYYQQHRKDTPNPGRILQNGSVSIAKDQKTSHLLYRGTLVEVYGSVERAPDGCQQLLQMLSIREDEWKDDFIQIDKIQRNERSAQSEGIKILMELEDMLNPNLPLYPNPTRDCSKFCSWLSPCVSMDDGSDWKHELELIAEPREPTYDVWRKAIVWPKDPVERFDFEADV